MYIILAVACGYSLVFFCQSRLIVKSVLRMFTLSKELIMNAKLPISQAYIFIDFIDENKVSLYGHSLKSGNLQNTYYDHYDIYLTLTITYGHLIESEMLSSKI